MIVLALFITLVAATSAGIISHGGGGEHGHATSYQHVNMESYHPVPVYIHKEDVKYLEHPVSQGHISTSVEVQHGSGHYGHGHEALGGGLQDAGGQHDAGLGGHVGLAAAAVHEAEASLDGQYGGGVEYSGGHVSQGYELSGTHGAAGFGHQGIGDGGYGHQNSALAFEHSSVVDHDAGSHYH